MEFLGIRTKSGAIVQPNSGEEMIRKFDFAYSTPGLTTGVVVYSPTVGDILLDAWIEIHTAFNGTTPRADISQFIGGNDGWFAYGGPSAVDVSLSDVYDLDTAGVLSAHSSIVYSAAGPTPAVPIAPSSLRAALNSSAQASLGAFTELHEYRAVPAKFTAANPVQLVVSQTGAKGGAATGATQGAGTVYFVTGTPQ